LAVVLAGCGKKKKTEEKKEPLTVEGSAKAIEEAIRQSINKPTGKLTKKDLEKVKTLEIGSKQITDLTPLSGLTGLEKLYLQDNLITDLKPLAGLKKLKYLGLSNNQITTLSQLGQMKDLEQLLLFGNPDITKAEIDKLKKILPKCSIENDAEK
jgi:Leucine-rich repeat (LRR) protein